MKPTNNLRFIKRREIVAKSSIRDVRVLQQWWEDEYYVPAHLEAAPGTWIDVPLAEGIFEEVEYDYYDHNGTAAVRPSNSR